MSGKPVLKLKWKAYADFPGEFYAHVGFLEFSYSVDGHWDVSAKKDSGVLTSIFDGKLTTGTAARNKCQRYFQQLQRGVQKCEKQEKQ